VKAFYADHFVLPLPPGHRFPMEKYSLLRQAVIGQQDISLQEAPAATDTQLLLAHDPKYVSQVIRGQLNDQALREIGFPWSAHMVERSRRSVGATIAACQTAWQEGVAVNLAGGTHHAYRYKGSGYCVFNDAAIAARVMQQQHPNLQVAIIDLDVHQGNGTAQIFKHDPSVFTVSIHGEKNFPFRKEDSDLDIALPDGCTDHDYLAALDQTLAVLSDRFSPNLLIYLAGADPHEDDRLGRLKISTSGMAIRDQTVFNFAKDRNIPVAVAMAGGYGKLVQTTVSIHLQTVNAALSFHQQHCLLSLEPNAKPRPQNC
jgi:acetoin utilization deacetylase AcuC-like enzyme